MHLVDNQIIDMCQFFLRTLCKLCNKLQGYLLVPVQLKVLGSGLGFELYVL